MMRFDFSRRAVLVAVFATADAICRAGEACEQSDQLPSWNDGVAKKSITDFVARVTAPGTPDFVPAERRIAKFNRASDGNRR
jgi:hypothetical protein